VATHKAFWMPEDALYRAVQAGSAGAADLGYTRDDSGENISAENPWYCELTGLFWAWKNLEADYLGLVHYRRYFTLSRAVFGAERKKKAVLTRTQLSALLDKNSILLPAPRHYYIENREAQFVHAHGAAAFMTLSRVIDRHFPASGDAFRKVMRRRWGHIGNMLVMRRDILNEYCSWLFDVLGRVKGKLQDNGGCMQPRILGYMGERLLDVWLEATGRSWRNIPYVVLETVNWPLKILKFLRRKYIRSSH
jgi:hypothetical protein